MPFLFLNTCMFIHRSVGICTILWTYWISNYANLHFHSRKGGPCKNDCIMFTRIIYNDHKRLQWEKKFTSRIRKCCCMKSIILFKWPVVLRLQTFLPYTYLNPPSFLHPAGSLCKKEEAKQPISNTVPLHCRHDILFTKGFLLMP